MDITFKIVAHIATLGTHSQGWTKELNVVSWNDGSPKYEIRDWSPDHMKCGKGATFTRAELEELINWGIEAMHDTDLPEANEY